MKKSLFLSMLAVVLLIAIMPRLNQQKWLSEKLAAFPTVPIFTSADAPNYIYQAKFLQRGETPDHDRRFLQLEIETDRVEKSVFDFPLLSFILAKLNLLTGIDHYALGNILLPFLANLFIIPLGFYFYRLGYPAIGLMSGLLASLSVDYLMRTSIGRIDTDQLNLFFPMLIAWFLLCLQQSRRPWQLYLYAVLSGLSLNLFMWWYPKTILVPLYAGVFVLLLLLYKSSWTNRLLCLAVFILATGYQNFSDFYVSILEIQEVYFPHLSGAITTVSGPSSIAYPLISTTINELMILDPNTVLRLLYGNLFWGWLGLTCALLFTLRHWRMMLPFLPILALGLTTFTLGRRFSMYLTPFIGMGIGAGLTYLLLLLPKRQEIVGYALALLLSWMIIPDYSRAYVPTLSFQPEVTTAFQELGQVTPANSVLMSSWDAGYALSELSGRKILFHGGTISKTRINYLVSRALSGSSANDLHQILRLLGTKSAPDLDKIATTPELLNQYIQTNQDTPAMPLYAVLHEDMIAGFANIFSFGHWNFTEKSSEKIGYLEIFCQPDLHEASLNATLDCESGQNVFTLDPTTGFINEQSPVRRVLYLNPAGITREFDFAANPGATVQFILPPSGLPDGPMRGFLLDEKIYQSNFNQMFFLGHFDEQKFEITLDRFPAVRVFKAKF